MEGAGQVPNLPPSKQYVCVQACEFGTSVCTMSKSSVRLGRQVLTKADDHVEEGHEEGPPADPR
jgi:hypothetical protein